MHPEPAVKAEVALCWLVIFRTLDHVQIDNVAEMYTAVIEWESSIILY